MNRAGSAWTGPMVLPTFAFQAGHIPSSHRLYESAVAGRCWLPMVAAVAVTVAVSRVDILRFVCGLW